jgi:hypothetical protein
VTITYYHLLSPTLTGAALTYYQLSHPFRGESSDSRADRWVVDMTTVSAYIARVVDGTACGTPVAHPGARCWHHRDQAAS